MQNIRGIKTGLAVIAALSVGIIGREAHAGSLVKASLVWKAPRNGERSKPYAVAYDSTHKTLWTANYGTNAVSIRAADDGSLMRVLRTGSQPTCVVIDERRHRAFVVNSGDDTVTCFNTVNFDAIETVRVGKRPQMAALDAKTGLAWVANCDDGTVSVLSPDRQDVQILRAGKGPCGIAVDSTRRRVYVANSLSASVKIFDADEQSAIGMVSLSDNPMSIAVDSESGALWITHSEKGCVSFLADPQTTRAVSIATGGYPMGLAIDSARGRVYVADYEGQTLQIFDALGRSLQSCDVARWPLGMTFDPTSGRVWVAGVADNTLDVLDLEATQRPEIRLAALPLPQAPVVQQTTISAMMKAPTAVPAPLTQFVAPHNGISDSSPLPLETPERPSTFGNFQAQNTKLSNTDYNTLRRTKPVVVAMNSHVTPEIGPNGTLAPSSTQRLEMFVSSPLSVDSAIKTSTSTTGNFLATQPIEVPVNNPITRLPEPPTSRPIFVSPKQILRETLPLLDKAPAGQLGFQIAQAAQKLQCMRGNYPGQCDRLADTAIRNATSRFNNIVGPQANGDTAARTMRRFQMAGIGFAYTQNTRLRPGDLLYAGTNVGGGCGHAMIVGPTGLILDQYGANARPTVRPQWVVRPDAMFVAKKAPQTISGAIKPLLPSFPTMMSFTLKGGR